MDILMTLLVGLVVGLVVKFFRLGLESEGTLVTIALGLSGAFVGSWLGRAAGWYRDSYEPFGLVTSAVGALLFIVIYTVVDRRRSMAELR